MAVASVPLLRPLNMGQIIDQAIRLYRNNLGRFIAIIAVAQVPLTLLQIPLLLMAVSGNVWENLLYGEISSDYYLAVLGNIGLSLLQFILVQGIAAAALMRAAASQYLGEAIGFAEAYRRIGRYWPRIVGALFLTVLMSAVLVIWLLIPCIGWITGMSLLLFLWLAIIPMIVPAIVLEDQRAVRAVRRAWDLLRQRFWWICGFVVMLLILQLVIASGPAGLLNGILVLVTENWWPAVDYTTLAIIRSAIQAIVSMLLGLFYLPLHLTCFTLLYLDLRVRTEGLDLEMQAQAALHGQQSAVTIPAPPRPTRPLVTWREIGNFALISLGAGLLLGLFYALLFLLVTLLLSPW